MGRLEGKVALVTDFARELQSRSVFDAARTRNRGPRRLAPDEPRCDDAILAGEP